MLFSNRITCLDGERCARALTLLACLLLINACSLLRSEVNKRWPPLDLAAATEAASADALNGLAKMERSDVYIGVSNDTIEAFAPRTVMSADPRIKALELELGRQAIIFDIDFDGVFDELKFSAAGDIKVAAVPSLNGLVLRVQPVAQHVHLDRLKPTKDSELNGMPVDQAAPLVTAVLNTFINNINGQIAAYTTELKFASSVVLRAEDLLGGLPQARNFQGVPYVVQATMEAGSVLIDQQGLHALVQSKLTREEVEPSGAQPAEQFGATSSYEAFATAFRELGRQHMGAELDARWSDTAAAASDNFVAAVVNTGLQPIGFGADFTIAPQSGSFDELIEIETTWDFDCSQSDMDCSMSHMTCSDHRSCDPRWNCPSCKWYQVDCHARKVGCEADKVRFRAQCEVERAASNALCLAEKTTKQAACEVVKAAKKAGCELNKAWLQLVNGADIGRLKGDYSLSETVGGAFLHGATVKEGLQKIDLDATLSGSSTVRFAADFQPYDLGYIACQAPTNLNLNTGISLKPQRLLLTAHKTGDEFEGDRLNLQYRTEGRMVTISTDQPPMLKLTVANPDFLFKCRPLAALVTIGSLFKKVREDLLRTDYEIDVDPFEFEVGIPGFEVPVFDGTVTYRPVRSIAAVWFEGNAAPNRVEQR